MAVKRYNRLDLNLLIALRALLTERNVTRAGEALHVSQSAMSGILARLRDYFDDPLIVPIGRKMALTPLGEDLVDKVHDVLMRIDTTLTSRPQFDPSTSKRRFSIVASDYVTQVLMAEVVQQIYREAPGIGLDFRQPSDNVLAELEAGEVDFVINPERYALDHQGYATLFTDSYHALVDRENARVGNVLTLDQYQALGHVAFLSNGVPFFESWFSKTHGNSRSIEVVANGFGALPLLVRGTPRVATVHTRLALQMSRELPLRMVWLDFAKPKLVETLQWHRLRNDDQGLQWLRTKIVQVAKGLAPLEVLDPFTSPTAHFDHDTVPA